jgi:hypothetical protein
MKYLLISLIMGFALIAGCAVCCKDECCKQCECDCKECVKSCCCCESKACCANCDCGVACKM